jgi:negative regulator of sigma E activity
MTCPEIQDRLDDYVDGTLSERDFQEVELHLHGCAECRKHEAALRSLLARAEALPEEIAPPRDLWPGIAARLGEKPSVARFPSLVRRPVAWGSLAAAAVVVLAVAALLRPSGGPQPGTLATGTPVALKPGTLDPAEQDYMRATSELMAALSQKREGLAPETQKAVAENLRVIDGALRDLRVALQKDPGNQKLNKMLVATHQKKVDMLRFLLKLNLPQGERQS